MAARTEDSALMRNRAAGSDRRHEHPCNGCYFFGGKQSYVKSCNYYLITGNRRPCEAGEGCTVRKDGKRGRKK